MELLDLPPELIPEYALSLNLGELNPLCSVNKKFNELICQNEHFWKMKFVHDYHFTPDYTDSSGTVERSWKKLYRSYNSLWSFGRNTSGQLGLGDRRNRLTPTLIPQLKAKAISAGVDRTVLIDLDDNVWSFGDNDYGQLGLGDRRSRLTPTLIPRLKAKTISAGGFHTVLVDLNDNVWTFGMNTLGQLGLGDHQDRSTPAIMIIPRLKAKAVSVGGAYTILIDLDDNVWSFGYNFSGQLGLGDQRGRSTPTRIPRLKAKAVATGDQHTVLIDLDDNVWTFGWNVFGQLGLGDQLNKLTPTMIPRLKAKAVSAGNLHTVVIDLENNVWSFGANAFGELGLGDHRDRLTPTLIPHPGTPGLPFKAKAVSAGAGHTLLIDLDDNVWSFGSNNSGQLGLGDEQDRSTPTLIPQLKAKAVSAGGTHTALIATLITS